MARNLGLARSLLQRWIEASHEQDRDGDPRKTRAAEATPAAEVDGPELPDGIVEKLLDVHHVAAGGDTLVDDGTVVVHSCT